MCKIRLLVAIIFVLSPSLVYGLKVKAVGDIMLQSEGSYLPQNYFHKIYQELSDADITFGNYEGTICESSEESRKCKKDEVGKTCYVFKSSPVVIDQLLNVGFDIMSIANNHIYDYGEYCANQTLNNLEQAGILAVGLRSTKESSDLSSTRIIDINGTRVGIIALHYSQSGGRLISINEYGRVTSLIKKLDKQSDIIIISFHGGDEGKNALNTGYGVEKHYSTGELRGDLRKISKVAINAGADLILGHGPHVPRGMELYRNKLIAYSLSNFATPWGFNIRSPMNMGLILEVNLNEETGNFISGKIISTKQSKNPASIIIDKELETVKLIKRLTKEDFNSPLEIDQYGNLLKIN